ncbi:hypothetical protein [Kordiimonas pumila]|uniref:DUF485 domain-containing protein n=1 Tax=Kordiimonas pumila TaxID=2161677 RepID=A0ABV7D954_9PROT|nr:hypothetical protein [Kordiimonas pumila]
MKQKILILLAVCFGVSIISYVLLAAYINYLGIEMSFHGYIAMGLGIFFAYAVGGGLMALLFFSNRSGHDEAAYHIHKSHEKRDMQE